MTTDFQSLEKTAAQTSNPWKKPVWLGLVAVAFAALPYLTSLNFSFVYDDHGSIAENAFLRQPDALAKVLTLRTFFEPQILDGQRPMVILAYLAGRATWNLNPVGFHVTSLLLHLACVTLLFSLLGKLAVSPFRRFAGALLFGLHPVLTEAVQLPANIKDLLATFFILGFLRLAVSRRRPAAMLALALALCSKETAVAAPALLAWIWICFPAMRPARRTCAVALAASSLLIVLYLAVTFTHRPLQAMGGVWNGLALRWPENLTTAPWVFARWIKTLAVPCPLCADYVVTPVTVTSVCFVAGIAALALVAALAFLARRRAPMLVLGAGWLLLNFPPVSNLVPLFNPMADRYLYLPAAGFALLLAEILSRVPQRRAVLAVVAAVYVGLATGRVQDWRNDKTLWTATARTEPRSSRAQTWLGLLAAERGDFAEAQTRYGTAFDLNPHDARPLINLAVMDGQSGNYREAEKKLRKAVEIRPDLADGWWNLAMALRFQNRDTEADTAISHAAKLDPYDPRWFGK